MGLFNAGDIESPTVQRGLEYLINNQESDGTWQEEWFTGTGFPRVFYLRYHFYKHYFPLWALAQYHDFTTGEPPVPGMAHTAPNNRFANLEV